MKNDCQVQLIRAIEKASIHWQLAFNTGDAASCANHYETDAMMHADPFGTFSGKIAIENF